MFGMSSTEFWEDDPQLYWAYRFSFIKKQELEAEKEQQRLKLGVWLNGIASNLAVSIALGNCFSKQKKEFPSYEEFFDKSDKEKSPMKQELEKQLDGVKNASDRGQIEFNFWARI